MIEEPREDAPGKEPEETDWAEEIKRLRAASGQRLAARLADDTEKEPPVA
ncbi:MAG TPA: hypothetical protein VJM84_06265 [Actinomycetota bacterium]|nr:hypothetical protein [Actinomycetota bacterium]